MNTYKSLFTVIFVLSIACSPNVRIRKINGDLIGSKDVDRCVRSLMDSAHVTGLCLALLNENKPVYIKAYGYRNEEKGEWLTTNSVMSGASLSKAVFSYIVMQLVQENVLKLDDPLYQYLDKPLPEYTEYRDLKDDNSWKRLTARMCLSHTTGFPNLRLINPRGNGKLEFFFEPGTRYAYSGEGIRLLQFIVEHITRTGLEELARERVFVPLGMTRTGFVWRDQFESDFALGHDIIESPVHFRKENRASASGSLLTTISDYARFVEAVMQGRGLERSLCETMLSPSIKINSAHQFPTLVDERTHAYDSIQLSYGLGWGVFTCPYGKAFFKEGHGNGCQNYNVNFLDQKTSIAILTNSDNGEKIFKDLLEKVIGDTYTPTEWEGYTPYDQVKPKPIGVYLYDVMLLENVGRAIERYKKIKKSVVKTGFIFDKEQLIDLGDQMIKENKYENAIALFQLNIEQYPGYAKTYFRLGEAYKAFGRMDLAIENYQKSLEIDPDDKNVKDRLIELGHFPSAP